MKTPKAVLISDVHFSLPNLDLASASFVQALDKAQALEVPLIIAGDLHDTKAAMRAECVNRLVSLFRLHPDIQKYVLIGNHDLISEKSKEHALNFLSPWCTIVDSPRYVSTLDLMLIPYYHDLDSLKMELDLTPPGSTIIMHQGVDKAWGGHYVHDKSAAPIEWFENYRVISGHYHKMQDIRCSNTNVSNIGLFSYIGTPYTMSFSESDDGQKGFRVLNSDSSLDFIPISLRKHVVKNVSYDQLPLKIEGVNHDDLLWVKVSGPRSVLSTLTKKDILLESPVGLNFKLDLTYEDQNEQVQQLPESQDILDSLVANIPDSEEYKTYLRNIIKDLIK